MIKERVYVTSGPNWSEALQPVGPEPGAGQWCKKLLEHCQCCYFLVVQVSFGSLFSISGQAGKTGQNVQGENLVEKPAGALVR